MIKRAPNRIIKCLNCDGKGQLAVYSYSDFEGVDECRDCNGSGTVCVYLNSGQVRKYPGGPRLGYDCDLSTLEPLQGGSQNLGYQTETLRKANRLGWGRE